jgi:hypothetical protein
MDRCGLRVRDAREKEVAFISPFHPPRNLRVRRDPTQWMDWFRMAPHDH